MTYLNTGYRLQQTLILICLLTLVACKSQKNKKNLQEAHLIDLPHYTLEESEKQSLQQQCAEWYDSFLNPSNFNGGILVAKNGVPVFEKYRGDVALKEGLPINENTPFHIASVTKTFTAMGILWLAQQNQLNIDTSLNQIFPGVDLPGVTIRTLLNHRSGLPNYAYFMEDLGWDKKSILTNQDILNALIQRKKEIKNIGRADRYFSYSNTNYALLALVLEKISGKSYAGFMQEHFFKPLNMKNTFVFRMNDSLHNGLSYDWKGQEIPVNFLDDVYGDKNIYSTPQDLLQWSRGLREGILFTKETLEAAFTPYSHEKPGIKNYGLGWRMNVYEDGTKTTFHNGWWHGNNAVFIHLIQPNATIIVLGNRFTRNIYKAYKLAGIFIPSLRKVLAEPDHEGHGAP